MAIQKAGSDIISAADIDMLLITAFETFGELSSVRKPPVVSTTNVYDDVWTATIVHKMSHQI